MDIPIGNVTHYYDKIGVAVLEVVNQPLHTGDIVRICGHDKEFFQTVSSLQIEHMKVESVGVGEVAALKVDQPVKPGDKLFLTRGK